MLLDLQKFLIIDLCEIILNYNVPCVEVLAIQNTFELLKQKIQIYLLKNKKKWKQYIVQSPFPICTYDCIWEEISIYMKRNIGINSNYESNISNLTDSTIVLTPPLLDYTPWNYIIPDIFNINMPTIKVQEYESSYLNKYTIDNNTYDEKKERSPYLPFGEYMYNTNLYCYQEEKILYWNYEKKFENKELEYDVGDGITVGGFYEIKEDKSLNFICDLTNSLKYNLYETDIQKIENTKKIRKICKEGRLKIFRDPE